MPLGEHIEIKKNKPNVLHIHQAVAEDSGMYTCLAKNEAGSAVTESYPLVVSGNETATLKNIPRNLIAKRGEPAALHCLFKDADEILWYLKDVGSATNVRQLMSDDERTIFQNGTLLIHAAEQRDQGFYSCHGIRDESRIIYTVELKIACKYPNFLHSKRVESLNFNILIELYVCKQQLINIISCYTFRKYKL